MIHIALAPSVTSHVTEARKVTWSELSQRLAQCNPGTKDGAGWLPVEIDSGPRNAERVKSVSLLVLDVEAKSEKIDGVKVVVGPEPPTPEAIRAELELWGWQCFFHTTFQHTVKHPRYRLVFELSQPIAPTKLKSLGEHIVSLLGLSDCYDKGALEPARFFYLPRRPADSLDQFIHFDLEGKALSVDDLLAEAQRITAAVMAKARRHGSRSNSIIDAYNAAYEPGALLEQAGYKRHGPNRWLYPGSTTGLPGVRLLPNSDPPRIFSSHAGDPLGDTHGHDSFDCFRILQHGGDMIAAVKAAAAILGIQLSLPNGQHTVSGHSTTKVGTGDGEASHRPLALEDQAYHGLVGRITRSIEPHTESDPAAILIQTLVLFGANLGRKAHIKVEGDKHGGNLFVLLVGDTAKGRKGTSLGRVRDLFKRISKPCLEVSGLSSGEGLKWQVRDPVIETKKSGEEVKDPGVSDKRLLVVEPEFAQVLRAISRQGNTLSATVRNAWDSGNLATLTKNDPTTATGAHIAIIGHITADELRAELTQTDGANGFANRFLFVCVRRSKCLPFGGEMLSESTVNGFAEELGYAIKFADALDGIGMNQEARGIWEKVYPVLSEGWPGMFGAVTGRAEAQVLRLALLYALLDKSREIVAAHLLAAISIWEYCAASAKFTFGSSLGDPVADEILSAVWARQKMTRTEIRDLFQRNQNATRIGTAIDLLQSRNLIRCESSETNGRPAELWLPVLITTT